MEDADELSEIGPWSEVKHEIIRKYAAAYSKILSKQGRLTHLYVDAFAGPGQHISRETGDIVSGSPMVVAEVKPAFREYHFVELRASRVSALTKRVRGLPNAFFYTGDCNDILLERILPLCRWGDRRRALWLLDPCGLDYNWRTVKAAGREHSVEVFLNFPIMAMNRSVLRRDPGAVSGNAKKRMDAFWGDHSWWDVAYPSGRVLFEEFAEKADGRSIVEAYCERLRAVAGFAHVAQPLLMRNRVRAPLYYMVFASPNATGSAIVDDIFSKYRQRDLTW